VGECEAGAVRGERVEIRRRGTPAVRSKCIGAQRVDCNEEDVAIGVRLERKTATTAARADAKDTESAKP
jgi:hypothetical protein